jgi:hypothetical protein
MSNTSLVRPGDITEAADAHDLLEQLRVVNFEKVGDSLDARTRGEMRKEKEREIRSNYNAKAQAYYDGLWMRCGESKVSHNCINMDIGDKTIHVCDTCSLAKGLNSKKAGYTYSTADEAREYNEELVRTLAKRLMSLDEEAGVLVWPQDDDFIGLERKFGQKSWFRK